MERKSRGALVDRWLLNAGAVLGSLCLVLAALSLVFGLKPLIFSSGSMGPAIPTGSLALAVPVAASEVSPGEVVSVVTSDGTRVTHRVVSTDPATGLVLKGDANAVADLLPYAGATVDKVLFSLPGLGYVLSWMASPWVFLLGGLLCAYLVYVAFFRLKPGVARKQGAGSGDGTGAGPATSGIRRRNWLGVGAVAAVIAVAVPLGAATKIEPTQATWTANAVGSSAVKVFDAPELTGAKCELDGSGNKRIRFSWDEATASQNGAPQFKGYLFTMQKNDGKTPPSIEGAATTERLSPSETTILLDIEESNGLLLDLVGGLLGALLGFTTYTYSVSIVAEYGTDEWTWASAPFETHSVKVSAGFLGSNKKVMC